MPQQTITTTPAQVLPKNPYRKSIIFHNASLNVIFIEPVKPGGLTTGNASIRIPANSTRTVDWFTDGVDTLTREWSAISDTGSNVLEFREQVGIGISKAVISHEKETD